MSRKRQTKRLRPKEVAEYRKKLLEKQGGLCVLCGLEIKPGEDTLDHCHDSGHVRAVLHRNCNQVEGRIRAWARRAYCEPLQFLQSLVDFWDRDYSHFALHPNHRTEKEKEIRRLKNRMKYLKTERAKQRYKDRIKELKEQSGV
jgi:exonuclease VII large subunit